jgi:carbonic anhydrase/acetyltransferase-like protein (isoleucine patch superfamily)
MKKFPENIRPNFAGDYPNIDVSALIDPSAQIIGNVRIGKNVIVGPLAVIRADERGDDGRIHPIILDEEVNVQDSVIIHSHGGESVYIGPGTSVAHGVIIHGPCTIGEASFLSMRATLVNVSLGASVWVGVGALVMQTTLPAKTFVPAGSVIRSILDADRLGLVSAKEKKYMAEVTAASKEFLNDYVKFTNNRKTTS